MKFKSLLLGTAAVFAVAGGARAADLAVAESVEYVKVCDAYGAGYFYIPGSDTCLKIGGDIQAWVDVSSGHTFESNGNISKGSAGEDDMQWRFYNRAELNVTAKSMTDWGALTYFANIRANHTLGIGEGAADFYMETAWAKIGGFKIGWDASTYDAGFLGADDNAPSNFDHDQHQLQVQWSTTVGGWGFFIAAEDPQDNPSGFTGTASNFGTSGTGYDFGLHPWTTSPTAGEWNGDWPDIVAAVTGGAGNFHWKGAVGITDTTVGTGVGGQLWAQWLSNGNSFTFQGALSNGAGSLYGANIQPEAFGSGTYWHVAAQVGFAVTQAFTILFEGGYQAAPGHSAWEATAEADWQVGKGAVFALEYDYLSHGLVGSSGLGSNVTDSNSNIQIMFKRSFD